MVKNEPEKKPEPEKKTPKENLPEKPKIAKQDKKLETTIYIGPTIANGQLLQNTVFRGDIPQRVRSLVEATPKLSRLIVPVTQLAEAKKRATMPGTPEFSAIQDLKGV